MIEEEKKAIEKIKNGKKISICTLLRTFKKEGIENFIIARKQYVDILLNLIQKQQEEIKLLKEQKECVIDEYSETIEKKDKIIDEIVKAFKQDDIRNVEEIKQYFEKKVEDK